MSEEVSGAKSLIEKLKPKQECRVPIADSEILFRLPTSAEEIYLLRERAKRFANGIKTAPSEQMKPYTKLPVDVLTQAYYVHALAADPPFEQLDALALNDCGGALPYMHALIMAEIGTALIQAENEVRESAKND